MRLMKMFREIREDNHAGAIGFVISMLILGMVVAALVGTFAYNIALAQANASVIAIPGGVAMLGLLALLFIVIPVVIFAKAAT